MQRATSNQVLVVILVALWLSSPAHAEKKPNGFWRGMGPVNDQYDWLRPPATVIENVLSRVHSGKVAGDALQYEYKKEVSFDGTNHVFSLTLGTPLGSAAYVAESARERFAPMPVAARITNIFRGAFDLVISVEGITQHDVPSIAILSSGRLIRPYRELAATSKPTSCSGYDLPCWYNTRILEFVFEPTEHLKGPGAIVFRWHGIEKLVPIHFDYLW